MLQKRLVVQQIIFPAFSVRELNGITIPRTYLLPLQIVTAYHSLALPVLILRNLDISVCGPIADRKDLVSLAVTAFKAHWLLYVPRALTLLIVTFYLSLGPEDERRLTIHSTTRR